MTQVTIQSAESKEDIHRCYPVMHELRAHLGIEPYLDQVERQMANQGYQMAFVDVAGQVMAVAGYRIIEMLAWGKALYVDDLVTAGRVRSQGYGDALFDWLVDRARDNQCDQFHLDSGVQRFAAHRFYLRKRMSITSHHFALELG